MSDEGNARAHPAGVDQGMQALMAMMQAMHRSFEELMLELFRPPGGQGRGRQGGGSRTMSPDQLQRFHDSTSDEEDWDTWEEVDPDELSYEWVNWRGFLLTGAACTGLTWLELSAEDFLETPLLLLPSINYKVPTNQDGNTDQ
ncbi:hypothetical protein Sjap_016760 [Stephania japonica]|uniref:Uncharacterized protein n=1 Tax=Stephania japonica TaxID=461633 RepID=A0AAP0NJI2_9MAGN